MVVLPVLFWLKRRLNRNLGSGSLEADAHQSLVCALLSASLLIGLVANALFGLWWIDPAVELGIASYAAYEGWVSFTTDRGGEP